MIQYVPEPKSVRSVYVYGAVPPVTEETETVPSVHVGQDAFVAVAEAARTAGSEIVPVVVAVQPLASVTV